MLDSRRPERDLNGPRIQALLRTLIEKKVVLTETPGGNTRRPFSEFAREFLDPSARERHSSAIAARPPELPSPGPDSLQARLHNAFIRAGGRVVLGSDPGLRRLAGLANLDTIRLLVNMGISPLEAIRIATLNGATFLDIQHRTGSIEAGKEADLLIVRGNPAERIEDIDNVEMVFTNGTAYDPKALLVKVKGQVGWH